MVQAGDTINILEAILLGIIQGITEWLPVSSSGHLVIMQEVLDIESSLFFDAMVHLGTLMVVVWIFRKEVIGVIKAFFEMMGDLRKGVPFVDTLKDDEHHLAFLIIIGTIPTGLIGLLFREPLESLYSNLPAVGFALLVTGCILFFTSKIGPCKRHGIKEMKAREALLIGIMQGIAIIPGISRSGSTISTGLYVGLDKEMVTRYSFLLFIPAILGATVIQTYDVITNGRDIDVLPTIVGTITAMIVGYFAIHLLLEVIKKSRLHLFSFYCWAIGITVIAAHYFYL